eukprot:8282274-Alexandrium_andersonii.AAC.1
MDCGSRVCDSALPRLRTLAMPMFVDRFGMCANSGAEGTRRELRGPSLRPFLGPLSPSSESLQDFCDLRKG